MPLIKVIPRDATHVAKELPKYFDVDTAFPASIDARIVSITATTLSGKGSGFHKIFHSTDTTDLTRKVIEHLEPLIKSKDTIFKAEIKIRRGRKWYKYARISVPENALDFLIIKTWKH